MGSTAWRCCNLQVSKQFKEQAWSLYAQDGVYTSPLKAVFHLSYAAKYS